MAAKNVSMFVPPDAPKHEEYEGFEEYARERGWELCVEWLDEWEDPEDGYVSPAGWSWLIRHEEKIGDLFYGQVLTISEHTMQGEAYWSAHLELAEMAWQRMLEEHGVA